MRATVQKKSSFQLLKEAIKQDGILSLWQGLVPALILVINPIIQCTKLLT